MRPVTRILIVARAAFFRVALARYLALLDAGYEVCGEAATGEAALADIARLQLPVVLLDLPAHDGLGLVREIRRRWPGVAVIAVVDSPGHEYGAAFRAAGANACLDKHALVEQLPDALAAATGAFSSGVVDAADPRPPPASP